MRAPFAFGFPKLNFILVLSVALLGLLAVETHAQDQGTDLPDLGARGNEGNQEGADLSQDASIVETQDLPLTAGTILVVDLVRVRTEAGAYKSVQSETEGLRDRVNAIYQRDLGALQKQRTELLEAQQNTVSADFLVRSETLEQAAAELERQRRIRLNRLESSRRQTIDLIDRELKRVLGELVQDRNAAFILKQESVLVWPEDNNVTDQVIASLNERLPAISFELQGLDTSLDSAAGQEPNSTQEDE